MSFLGMWIRGRSPLGTHEVTINRLPVRARVRRTGADLFEYEVEWENRKKFKKTLAGTTSSSQIDTDDIPTGIRACIREGIEHLLRSRDYERQAEEARTLVDEMIRAIHREYCNYRREFQLASQDLQDLSMPMRGGVGGILTGPAYYEKRLAQSEALMMNLADIVAPFVRMYGDPHRWVEETLLKLEEEHEGSRRDRTSGTMPRQA